LFLRQPVTENYNETRERLQAAELDEFVTLTLGYDDDDDDDDNNNNNNIFNCKWAVARWHWL